MPEAATSPGTESPQNPAVDVTVDAGRLDAALAVVGALVDECRVEFTAEGLRVRAVDPASVAAVALDLPAAACEAYEAAGETVGVNIERFAEVVSLADSGSTVRLALDTDRNQLHVGVGELAYTLGLIDPEAIREPLDPAEMEYDCPASLTVSGRDVARCVRAADMVADHLAFGVEEAGFYAEATGDVDDVSLSFPATELSAFEPAEVESLFSLAYLQDLVRPIPTDAEVAVELGTEQPVTFSFDVSGGEATYLLSPRRRVE